MTFRFRPASTRRALALLAIFLLSALRAGAAADGAPAFTVGRSTAVKGWLVAGPFPKINDQKSTDPLFFLNRDYLAALGGEAKARPALNQPIAYRDADGTSRTARAERVAANAAGIVDLNAHFGSPEARVAYAWARVKSPREQEATCFFGSADGIRVWVNGEVVQTKPGSVFEQSCIARQLQFPVKLRKGENALLVKVENTKGDWAFIVELAEKAAADKIKAALEREKLLKDFQNAMLFPDAPGKFIITPGAFPPIVWKDPAAVEKLWGKLPLRTRWFDGALNEVKSAQKPGRYAAYVEAKAPDGRLIRRQFTVFCTAPGDPVLKDQNLSTATLQSPSRLVSQSLWDAWRPELKGLPLARFFNPPDALRQEAVFLSALADLTARGETIHPWRNKPDMIDIAYHYQLKRKILDGALHAHPLAPPRPLEQAAPVLRPGSEREAGVKPGTADRLRAVCRDWAAQGGESFTALVARHGIIILHEPFSAPKTTVTLETRYSMDSITKCIGSILFLRFLDQRLVGLDDPVGKYLPGFPSRGPRALTLHHCVSHTSGLEGHGAWGGLANPWLENTIANAAETLRPGEVAIYNGMGFDLVGKVEESITGKNIFDLIHEGLFDPLGLQQVELNDLGFTAECNAMELARLGQLLLNRGSYGKAQFFTPATFEKMMPRRATELFPKIPQSDWEYGIGLAWTYFHDPLAGKNGVPKDKTILGRRMIGHGALSTSVFRVDLDNDIVIAIPRTGGGKDMGKFEERFLRALEEGLE